MADYTTINKSSEHFGIKLYTGNGSNSRAITGVGFQPDWVWIKNRNNSTPYSHQTFDSVRGAADGALYTDLNNAKDTSYPISSFDSDGFTLRATSHDSQNGNGNDIVAWNWLAGGASPSQTYVVKVVSDSGNKYRFDDFGTSAVTLDLQEGGTYTFDQADSSNSGHPLRFYTASDKSGGEYTTGVTTNGTPGSSGAYTRITVAASAPTLYYQCSAHAGMGGQVNTNSTFGSSNFKGSIQSTVSTNTTAGFSIVRWTGTGSVATIGHGLSEKPKMIIVKNKDKSSQWATYHHTLGADEYVALSDDGATATYGNYWNDTEPTTTVFTVGSDGDTCGGNGEEVVAYCFHDVHGYSKFGTYKGNGSSNNAFIYTGFKPTFFICKRYNSTARWCIWDSARDPHNGVKGLIYADLSSVEGNSTEYLDFHSNGIKIKDGNSKWGADGDNYIYMAFGQSLVGSNDIACTAR